MGTVTGNSRGNTLAGTDTADVIYGLGGADRLSGGGGNDVLYGDDDSLAPVFGSAGDQLDGGAGRDLLVGGAGADRLAGGDGDDLLIGGFASNASSDGQAFGYTVAMATDGGDDSYDGGAGFDVALVTLHRADAVVLDISLPDARAITAGGAKIGTTRDVEAIIAFLGDGDDKVTGAAATDELHGGAGNDALLGGGGADRVDGGAGNDRLNGGDGFDTLSYADATAGVRVFLALAGRAQNTHGAGIDTISGFEQLDGSNFTDLLTGTTGADFMTAGNGGDDRLFGDGGDDALSIYRFASDTPSISALNGGAGNDVLTTGAAIGATDRIDVVGGGGYDTAYVTVSARQTIDLGGGEDRLVLTLGTGEVAATLGRGVDTVGFADAVLPESQTAAHIRDFGVGNNGDRIDLRDLLAHAEGYAPASNPFAAGYVRLVASDSGTALQFDGDGAGTDAVFVTILELDGTKPQDFTAFNFGGTDPRTSASIEWTDHADHSWPAATPIA